MTKANLKIGLEGRYMLVATKPDGSKRVLADWFENLILDGGLNRLGSGGVWNQAQVGTGSTAPDVAQSSLATLLATTTTITSTVAGTNSPTNTYAWGRRTYRFAEGVAAGNLSEVGVGWGAGLFSRSLIKDEFGNPTTITVLSDEVLDVVYEVRMYPTMTDQTVVLTINSTPYTFTIRPALFSGDQTSTIQWPWNVVAFMTNGATVTSNLYMAWSAYGVGAALAAITGIISGTQVVSSSNPAIINSFTAAYVNNSYQRQCRVRFGLDAGSVSFAGFLMNNVLGTYQITVSPALAKDATKIFSLDYTLSWARRP